MKPVFAKTKNVKGFINLIHNLKNKPENISKILVKQKRHFTFQYNMMLYISEQQIP